jgi:DNA replication initiation complex subunit (GINS family)
MATRKSVLSLDVSASDIDSDSKETYIDYDDVKSFIDELESEVGEVKEILEDIYGIDSLYKIEDAYDKLKTICDHLY